ncbi:AraC family transcriptional regulator [Flavisolibacter ginsenosidimutans]|uniref:Helix-turn-helix domain-containing protein n=1 Tax=Flavisolibacter ginsenosidimutans TaxID=661481 RepID=A0A5B8UHC7_9BACT|nr:helix-turn-helix transcriptional regulator [Flavisolibacter ginsenosidimutans]QEC55529.1 helix-turn-helix domain-containing protein [Flavisolibacter ginsenosidimutans]
MNTIPIRHIAAATKESSSLGRFSIRDVSGLLNGSDLSHDLHKHDFFFVLALQKGAGTHEVDFIRYNISDDSIFILRPGQVHQLHLNAGSQGFLMEFDTTFYHPSDNQPNQRLKKASAKNFCELETARFKKLFSLLTLVSEEFTSKQEGYIEVIRATLDIFFIEFIRQSRGSQDLTKKTNSYAQERLEDFLELLSVHITSQKQVSQYAELMRLSLYQLNAITKATIGKPALEVINEQIILEAKRYLLATPSQVKDIADRLGYEDISYFIRFFRKHTSYSPEAFRQNFK